MINQPAETAEKRKLKCILRFSCPPVCVLKSGSFSLGNNFINWQRTVFFWPGPRLSRLDCSQGIRCVPQSGPRYQLTILVLDMIKKKHGAKILNDIYFNLKFRIISHVYLRGNSYGIATCLCLARQCNSINFKLILTECYLVYFTYLFIN